MNIVNFIYIVSLFNTLLAGALGTFVFLRDKRNKVHRKFSLMSLAVVVWAFGNGQFLIASTHEASLLWVKELTIGSTLIPILYYHWIAVLLGKEAKEKKRLVLGYVLTFIFLALIFTPFHIQGVSAKYAFPHWPNGSFSYLLYIIVIYVGIFGYAFLLQIRALRSDQSPQRKAQNKYVLLGSALAVVGGFTNFPLWFDIPIYPIGNMLVGVYTIIYTYTIVQYRLMDIRVVINKSVVYATLTAIFVGLTAFFAMLLGNQITREFTTNILLSATIVAVMIALAFPLLHKLVQSFVDKFIFRPNAHHPYMLQVSHYTLARCDTVVGLANESERLLDESLGIHPTLFVLNTFAHEFEPTTRDRGLTRSQTNTLMNVFPCDTRLMFRDDIPRLIAANPYAENLLRDTDKMMQSRRFAAIVPLISAEAKLHGLFAIPEKENAYSQEDASFLLSFADTLERRLADVVAYEHALKGIQALLRERGRL